MQLKNCLNRITSVNTLLISALLVLSQQHAFANEKPKELFSTLVDNSKSTEVFKVKTKVMDKIKVTRIEKLAVKTKQNEKIKTNKLGKTENKNVLTELVARKNIPQRITKPLKEPRAQLNKLVVRATRPTKENTLSLKG